MSNNNFHIITIPISVAILSLVGSGIWYLLIWGISTLIKRDCTLGWTYFFKTAVIFFIIIFGKYIYEKLKEHL